MCECGHPISEHGDRAVAACAGDCPVFERINAYWENLHDGRWTCPCKGWEPTSSSTA